MDSISIESELTDLSNITQDHDDKIDKIMHIVNQLCERVDMLYAINDKILSCLFKSNEGFEAAMAEECYQSMKRSISERLNGLEND